jgi:hypothetical protein
MSFIKKTLGLLLLLFVVGFIGVNARMPLGLHVSVATKSDKESDFSERKGLIDIFVWRAVSRWVVDQSGQPCDLPQARYPKEGGAAHEVDPIKAVLMAPNTPDLDQRLSFLMTRYDALGNSDAYIKQQIAKTIRICGPEGAVIPTEVPPLHMAIAFKQADIAEMLVRAGADTNRRMSRTEKPGHNLTALDFAKLVLSNAQTEQDKAQLQSIVDLLQKPKKP